MTTTLPFLDKADNQNEVGNEQHNGGNDTTKEHDDNNTKEHGGNEQHNDITQNADGRSLHGVTVTVES